MIYRLLVLFLVLCTSIFADSPQTDTDIPETKPIITAPPAPMDVTAPESAAPVTTDYEHAFVKMMLTLVILLILIIATIWLLRRFSSGRLRGMNRNLSIKVLERRPLSQKTNLYIIEAAGKKILVSESQWEVRTLSQMEEEAAPLDTEA